MTIHGKYLKDFLEFKDCEILIENGRLYNVSVFDVAPISAFEYPPRKNTEFEFEKLPSDNSKNPFFSNYLLSYVGQMDNPQSIYLQLGFVERNRLKLQLYYHSDKGKTLVTDLFKMTI